MVMVCRFRGDDPHLLDLLFKLGPYFIPQHDFIGPLFLQKKISLSLSHLVPEILGPKVDLFFHENVLFNSF